MGSLGVMFRRNFEPEALLDAARSAEVAGFDELWVVEDLGFHGGFTQCAAALAVTERITVGLGIAPAVVRNAAFNAMEIATLGRMFPGRFHMGLGHGVDVWIDQVGARPPSWLRSLGETTEAIRRIVRGDNVTMDGDYVHLDNIELVHPVRGVQPLVSLGVRQPKSIALAAAVADGVILAECSGPRYVAETRRTIGASSRLTVFVNATEDLAAARTEVETRLGQARFQSQVAAYAGSEIDMVEELVISGPASTWVAQSQRWFDAGADAVIWTPLMTDEPPVLDTFAAALRPPDRKL